MRLMLLRHGKPESESPTGRDFDCPLAKEGFRQAQFIAAQLGEGRKLAERTTVAVLLSPAACALTRGIDNVMKLLDSSFSANRSSSLCIDMGRIPQLLSHGLS